MEYYTMPLDLGAVMRGKKLDEIDVRLAIHQNIRLMLESLTLSYRFDPTFGCVLNKFHASTPPQGKSKRAWREEIRDGLQKNLKDLLQRYETRVEVKEVLVDMQDPDQGDHSGLVRVRVEIEGNLTLGRKERFHYPDSEVLEEAQEPFPLLIPIGRR